MPGRNTKTVNLSRLAKFFLQVSTQIALHFHTPCRYRYRMGSELLALIKMVYRNVACKITLQTWVVLMSLLVFSQLGLLAEGAESNDVHTETEDYSVDEVVNVTAATTPADVQNTTLNTTSVGSSSTKGNTGAIVAAAIIAVTACFAVVLGVYLFKRRRQFRMQDKEKKMQIQMSSARNAGVYHDLTVSVPADDKPSASPEHEHLKATEEA